MHNSIGKNHDFKLFKNSRIYMHPNIKVQVDIGYQGIKKQHTNSELPRKRSKINPLTKEDKIQNQKVSSSRVLIKNIIRELKIFRIVAEKYRNRRRRFNLRINIITEIYNLQVK